MTVNKLFSTGSEVVSLSFLLVSLSMWSSYLAEMEKEEVKAHYQIWEHFIDPFFCFMAIL